MTADDAWKFLAEVLKVGGTSAAIVYGLVKWFGNKWLDSRFATKLQDLRHEHERNLEELRGEKRTGLESLRHEHEKNLEEIRHEKQTSLEGIRHTQLKELEKVRNAIQRTFNRVLKIHEREYEVLPKAWFMLHDAFGMATKAAQIGVNYIDIVSSMDEGTFKEFLSAKPFSKNDKEMLLASDNRQQDYQRVVWGHELASAFSKQVILNNYVIEHRIFMSDDLAQSFFDISTLLRSGLNEFEIGKDSHHAGMMSSAKTKILSVEPLLPPLQKRIQERLGFHQA